MKHRQTTAEAFRELGDALDDFKEQVFNALVEDLRIESLVDGLSRVLRRCGLAGR